MAKKTISILVAVLLLLSVAVVPVSASGDSFQDATPISLNTEYSGAITDLNPSDYYVFQLNESGRVSLQLFANIYKSNIYLYDAGWNKLWACELLTWNEATQEARLEEGLDLTAGTYYLIIDQQAGTGAYRFRLDLTSASESFSEVNGGQNNDIATASSIGVGTTYRGQIALNDKTDFYRFELSKSGRVNLILSANIYKTNYFLYDGYGNVLWEKTNQTWNGDHEYRLDENFDLTAGTYYLEVRQYLETGNYNFKLTFADAKESFPETTGGGNNDVVSASAISLGKVYIGQLALDDHTDFYKFTMPKAGKVCLRLTSNIYKTNFYLYDAEGSRVWYKELQTWNTATHEYNLETEINLPAGICYFEVRQYSGTGNYQFSLEKGNPFSDVQPSDFYYNPVLWAIENDVTGGTSATTFSPERVVKRADAMVFFWAASGRPKSSVTKSPFKDVKKSHWAFDAVMWAVENGITGGTDATHFSPNQDCSRSEILQFLYAAMGKPPYTISNPYSDLKRKHWYYDGAIWAYENGLERGENGKFNAKTPCTRGYVVTYLYRFITGEELAQ